MSEYNKEELEEWLRTNTKLAESSIRCYMDVFMQFYRDYDKVTMANLKGFISQKNRENNMVHVRAPWFHFFQYKGMDKKKAKELYEDLPRIRVQPIKREGTYLPDNILYSIYNHIKDPQHRDICYIRHHTGIRIFEALTIREEMISRIDKAIPTANGPVIRPLIKITIQTKRGKNRAVFLTLSLARQTLQKYCLSRPGFLFLPRHYDNLSQAELLTKIKSEKVRYFESLKMAAQACNLKQPFASHDIRRNFAERCRRMGMDMELTRRMMGHCKIETTARYFDKNPEDVALGSAKLQGVI